MVYTNNRNLPGVILRAVARQERPLDGTPYSVTELLKSVCAIHLMRRHHARIAIDVSDSIYRLMGSALGKVLELGTEDGDLSEYKMSVDTRYGAVTGTLDYYDASEKHLMDFKQTSVATLERCFRDGFGDYKRQLELYVWMLERNGFSVEKISNVFFLRNFTERDASRFEYSGAPGEYRIDSPIVEIFHVREGTITTDGQPIEQWLNSKLYALKDTEDALDIDLPVCSLEYRWTTPTTYNVYLNESKSASPRAVRICKSEEEAKVACTELANGKKTYRYQYTPCDQWVRCKHCDCSSVCPHYQLL